jgi:hypothetical protein
MSHNKTGRVELGKTRSVLTGETADRFDEESGEPLAETDRKVASLQLPEVPLESESP